MFIKESKGLLDSYTNVVGIISYFIIIVFLLWPILFVCPLRLNDGGAVSSSISDAFFFIYFMLGFEGA